MSDPSRGTFTDADLDRLESLISTPEMDGVLMPDAMQGLFCAVASAPAPIARERWMPAVLGEDAKFASAPEEAEITDLVDRFHADTVRRLASGEGLDLLFYPGEEGEEEEDLAVWCEGYLIGVGLADPDWFEAGEEEVIEDLLFPFMALSGRLKEITLEAGEPWHSPQAEEEMMAEARERIADDIVDAYQYWFQQRIVRVPVKREEAKVGRNDPCPCGSGRKFKNCCGAA